MQLFESQVADVDYLEERGFVGLLNMQPGSGKTLVSLAAVERSKSEVVLVVAPQSAQMTAWGKDAEKFFGWKVRVIGNSRKAEKEAFADFEMGVPGIYVITPQLFTRSDVSNWYGDMLIVDEGHMLNNYKGKGSKKLLSLVDNFPYRLFLSGTAFRNSFERAWVTGRFLWPELSGHGEVANKNYYLWLHERMTSEEVYTNQRDMFGKPKRAKKWLAEAEPGKWISECPSVVTHFKREKCCEFHPNGFLDLEEPQVNTHTVELLPAQKRIIKELEMQGLAWLEEDTMRVDLPLTLLQRIRAVCLGVPEVDEYVGLDVDGVEVVKQKLRFEPDCKSPFAEFLIEELLQSDDNAVVYLESQSFAPALVAKLQEAGISAFEFSGATRPTRQESLKKFGTEYRVMVAVISAAGTGTDGIQDVAHTEYWLERSVDETANIQAESRVDRRGVAQQVQRNFIVDSLGYAEGRLGAQLEARLRMQKSLKKA